MAKAPRLAANQRRALERLKASRALEGFYLAGGTALGLELGHRTSLDLDFFSLDPDLDLAVVERRLRRADGGVKVVAKSDVALKLEVEGTAVDLVSYPYPLLESPKPSILGVPTAALLDLSVMKLAAVAQRGLRRDYWDLYEILHAGVALEQIAQAFLARFGKTESDLYHVGRALAYFDDSERDARMPRGLTAQKWTAIKRYLAAQAPRLLNLSQGT